MDRKEIQTKFGNNLRKYRLISGKSQEELALMADISPIYLGTLERGEKCPSIETLLKLSAVLQIYPARLLEFYEEPDEKEAYSIIKYALKNVPDKHKNKLARVFEALAKAYGDEL
ncbi:MAG: helix-turn-helix domain-containing protein [Oscillospiraceae bacterium]|nr:helix-turn-helix domain-containing protein [Oscillospiraceae bacterium]